MSAGLELDRFLADLGAERDLMPAQSGRVLSSRHHGAELEPDGPTTGQGPVS